MKKKILFTLLTLALFICLFAVVVGAEQIAGYQQFEVKLLDGSKITVYESANWDQWQGRLNLTDATYTEPPVDTEATYPLLDWSQVVEVDFTNGHRKQLNSKTGEYEVKYGTNDGYSMHLTTNGFTAANATNLKTLKTGAATVMLGGSNIGALPALEEVICGEKLKNIGWNALQQSKTLKTVDFSACTNFTTFGQQAFIGCTALESIVLPNTITSMGGNVFQGCTALKSVNWPTTMTKIPGATFNGCTSLPNFIIPSHVTEIGASAFNGCTSFTEINIPSTVEYIGSDCWRGCTGVTKIIIDPNCPVTHIYAHTFDGTRATEITLPNSVEQIGQSNFNSGTYVTINLGASFVGFQASNGTQPPFALGSSLKYIYLSDTFDCVRNAVFSWNDNNANEYNNIYLDLTFFYTGTKEQAESIVASAKDVNTYISSMTVISASDYAKAVADGTLVTGVKGTPARYMVYGYNKCEAFYGGEHAISEDATLKFEDEDYISRYISICACTRGCGSDAVTEICGPLFKNKGYSVYEENSKGNITYGIYVDEANVEAYEKFTGNDVSFGFVVGNVNDELDGKIIGNDGTCLLAGAIATDFATSDFKSFSVYNLKLTGIATDAQKSKSIYCGTYVVDGGSVSYIGDNVTDKAVAVSYNAIYEAKKDEE